MVERTFDKRRYITAFFITTSIFVIGLLLGSYFTTMKLSALQDLEQDLRTQLASYDIQSTLVAENPCQFTDVNQLVTELGSLADRLTAMEDQLGKNDKSVLKLKQYYSLLEVKHWLFLKKLNAKCGTKYSLFLYFYSGDETACPSCSSQGYILSYLRTKYDFVRVYSFDVRLQDPTLNALRFMYNITAVPSIVANDQVYHQYLSREELERLAVPYST